MIATVLLAASALVQSAPMQDGVAVAHVDVVDGAAPVPRRDQTVVVRGTRIVAVGPAASTPVPKGVRTVDGRGKYLIPGLWDMHVHTDMPGGRQALPLYVVNGVTGVRDMAGRWEQLTAWRREIAAGTLVGPRIVASGPYLEGGDVPIPHFLVKTPADVGPALDSLQRLGVDFVKIHGQLTTETYYAAAREMRARHIVFAGHVPRGVSAAEASDSGQKSIEHMLAIPLHCTLSDSVTLLPRFPLQRVLGRCTSEDLAPLYARFVRNGTWMVPTLTAQVEFAVLPKRELPGDAFGRYIPDSTRQYIEEIFEGPVVPKDVPAGADEIGMALFTRRLAQVAEMHRAGVGIMAGTDAPLRNSPPGFGLHLELAYLAQAGLSPLDVLRAATLAPAQYFGTADSMGTVAAGKVADLVLLDANPLDDVANLKRIAAVIANGRLFDAAARRAMLGQPH